MKVALLLALTVFQTQTAYAYSATCDAAANRAAETYQVPLQVLLAITRVETGRNHSGSLEPWPWAVNQAGTSHWFETKAEAEEFVQGAIQAGQSNIDIGCFQLNFHWHGDAFSSVQDMFDPMANADHAARFLVENYQRKGNWVDAVAAYHSASPTHAEAYIEKVEAVLTALAESSSEASPAAPELHNKLNRFPLLQPGGSGAMASLVPNSQSAIPLLIASP